MVLANIGCKTDLNTKNTCCMMVNGSLVARLAPDPTSTLMARYTSSLINLLSFTSQTILFIEDDEAIDLKHLQTIVSSNVEEALVHADCEYVKPYVSDDQRSH